MEKQRQVITVGVAVGAVLLVAGISALVTAALLPAKSLKVSLAGTGATIEEQTGGLSVSGSGTAYVAPDLVKLSVGVEVRKETVEEAQSAATQTMGNVITAIKNLGVEDKNLQTSNYSVQPYYEDSSVWGDEKKIDFFIVSSNLYIRLEQLDKVGEVINAAVGAGANSIGSLEFTLKDFEAARQKAYSLAADMATERAGYLAKELDVTLGQLLEAEAVHYDYQPYYYSSFANQAVSFDEASAGLSDAISAGQVEVKTAVNLRYGIVE
ncbi:MAG TPA: SIMPL domain-containing protein [bacterium]|nr:SIMPL domain-containing protein [bacterium]